MSEKWTYSVGDDGTLYLAHASKDPYFAKVNGVYETRAEAIETYLWNARAELRSLRKNIRLANARLRRATTKDPRHDAS